MAYGLQLTYPIMTTQNNIVRLGGRTLLLLAALVLFSCGGSSANTTAAVTASTTTTYTSATTTTTSGSCVAISSSIPFYGSSLATDSSGDLYGGVVPSSGTYGTITVGSTSSITGTTYSSPSGATDGVISMAVSSTTSTSYYTSSTATVSGTLSISAATQATILSDSTSGSFGTASSSPCVSGLAIQGGLYTSGKSFVGYVFVYLNNTTHGYVLDLD